MILCAGLSPAWQHTLRFERFELGEVNRAKDSSWCASGKVVNVAVALANLGAEHRMLTVVGGWPEVSFRESLSVASVNAELIHVQSATRVCTTLLADGGRATELVEECGQLSDEERRTFETAFARAAKSASTVVIAGSIPAGVDRKLWRTLLENAKASIILDIRGVELIQALSTMPLLVKPNREEIASTVGRPLETESEIVTAAEEVRRRGAQWVLVTDGTRPALLVGDSICRLHSPCVKAVNPMGCGDSLAAGIAWRITLGEDVREAVRWGVAAAAANAETDLPARFEAKRVEELTREVRLEVLS